MSQTPVILLSDLDTPEEFNQKYKNVATINYMPDSQPHVVLDVEALEGLDSISVTTRLSSFQDLGTLCLTKQIMDRINPRIHSILAILYPFGSRQDRVTGEGTGITAKVIANIINSLNFDRVTVFKSHSYVFTSLLNNFIDDFDNIAWWEYLDMVINDFDPDCIVLPDAGASVYDIQYQQRYNLPTIQCLKKRNKNSGKIESTRVVDKPGKRPLIIGDLCDGGSTFINIAKSLKDSHPKEMGLAVAHGIFSQGFSFLFQYFSKIYTTNSYKNYYEDPEGFKVYADKLFTYNLTSGTFSNKEL